VDAIEGKPIADNVEYAVNLEEIRQALINSDNIGLVNQPISFHGITTPLAGNIPEAYFWNYGNGFRPGGPKGSHVFGTKGKYTVQLGLQGQKDSLGIIPEKCFEKVVRIFNSFEEIDLPENKGGPQQIRVFLMDDLSEIQRGKIKQLFNKTDFQITRTGDQFIEPAPPVIEQTALLLIADQGLRLETRSSEKHGQELSWYFRDKGLTPGSFHCGTFDLTDSSLKSVRTDNKSSEKTVEFIFMKSDIPDHD
jgi:hypothetical protein